MRFAVKGPGRPGSSSRPEQGGTTEDKTASQQFAMKLKWCWSKRPMSAVEEQSGLERGSRSRPDFGFCDGVSPEREDAYTGSSFNEEFFPTDEQGSDTLLDRQTPESSDAPLYRQVQQECEALRKEKLQLSRALYDLEAQSEALASQCSRILQENNDQLQAALHSVSELNGIVKYLKTESEKQSNTIADLKMEKSVLNNRLEAALGELYKRTGNTTFTLKEKLLITPRHPYGSITLTSTSHD